MGPVWWGGWQWAREGEKIASINLRADADRLNLSYRMRVGGGEWEDVAETVPIVRAACRFGGARPGTLFPVPALLPSRARQPERGRPGSSHQAREQDQPALTLKSTLARSASPSGMSSPCCTRQCFLLDHCSRIRAGRKQSPR
jgi:hypothetical protein